MFDEIGNLESETKSSADIVSKVSTYKYSDNGRFLIEYTDPRASTITTTYDENLALPLRVESTEGNSVNYVYDGFGKELVKITQDGSFSLFCSSRLL